MRADSADSGRGEKGHTDAKVSYPHTLCKGYTSPLSLPSSPPLALARGERGEWSSYVGAMPEVTARRFSDGVPFRFSVESPAHGASSLLDIPSHRTNGPYVPRSPSQTART